MMRKERQVVQPRRQEAPAPGRRPVTQCPVCESTETLKTIRGMVLCTSCCWAIEEKAAS